MARGIRFNYDDKTVIRNIRLIRDSHQKVWADAAYQEIEAVETPECQVRTPVKTGDLQSTVRTEGPIIRGKTIFVGTVAGGLASSGRDVDYAISVHENTEAYHANGQAKFIESVYRESAPFLPERIAHRIDLSRMMRRI